MDSLYEILKQKRDQAAQSAISNMANMSNDGGADAIQSGLSGLISGAYDKWKKRKVKSNIMSMNSAENLPVQAKPKFDPSSIA